MTHIKYRSKVNYYCSWQGKRELRKSALANFICSLIVKNSYVDDLL